MYTLGVSDNVGSFQEISTLADLYQTNEPEGTDGTSVAHAQT